MRGARVVGALGRTLVAAGVLLLLFVAYQLWGTGLREARAQDDLRDDFEAVLATTTTTTTSTTVTTSTTATTPPPGPPPPPRPAAPPPTPEGEAVALLRIPRIGVDKAVVAGVGVGDLKKGPGHYPSTPLPGQPGNAAIAGHRTTYGAPFYRLDELAVGDEILVTTRQGEFRFEVDRTSVVRPTQLEVLDPTPEARLTLTTCNPRFSARQRLVVSAVLASPAAPPAPTTTTTAPVAGEPAPDDEPEPEPAEVAFAGEDVDLSGADAARAPAARWGVAAAAVWLLTWAVGRRWRRLPAYLVGTPVFLVVLFTFYENVARLLPANI